MKKNEIQPVERRVYAMFDFQIRWFRNHWRSELATYQKLVDELFLIGLEPTPEMLDDLISSSGKNTSQALSERGRIEAVKTGISNPEILKMLTGDTAKRLAPALEVARSIMTTFASSMLPTEMKTAIHWKNINLDGRVVSISDEKIESLIDEFFTVYVQTERQKRIFELAENCLPGISEIFREARKHDQFVKFNDLFEFETEKGQYILKPSVMHFFGQAPG